MPNTLKDLDLRLEPAKNLENGIENPQNAILVNIDSLVFLWEGSWKDILRM